MWNLSRAQLKNTRSKLAIKNRFICMCSKLKINTAWHRSGVFIVDFDHSLHINIVFLLLTLNKYLSLGCERQVMMFWKHKKRYICFIINIARPFSFSNSSLHRIELNYDHIRSILSYEHIMDICFSSKFALAIPSEQSSFRLVIWSAISSLFLRDLIFFALPKRKPI